MLGVLDGPGEGKHNMDEKQIGRDVSEASNAPTEVIDRIQNRMDFLRWGWADLARAMGITEQRVNNWRTRGVPTRELRNVEVALKVPRYALDAAEAQQFAEMAVNVQGAKLGNAKENRLQNLRWPISTQFGGNAGKFADFLEMKCPQMSRWVTDNDASRQGISEESAREIESSWDSAPARLTVMTLLKRQN